MANCVANAVILGEGLDLVEVVLQVEVLPAVGITHGEVELDVETAQFEQRLELFVRSELSDLNSAEALSPALPIWIAQ